MKSKTFFSQLLLTTVIAAAFIFILGFIPVIQAFNKLGWISILFFVVWCAIMFFASLRAAKSENKNTFTSAIVGFTFGKLILSAGFIIGWFNLTSPTSSLFLLTFFGVYLIYTIFETNFMMKLGKMQYKNEQ